MMTLTRHYRHLRTLIIQLSGHNDLRMKAPPACFTNVSFEPVVEYRVTFTHDCMCALNRLRDIYPVEECKKVNINVFEFNLTCS